MNSLNPAASLIDLLQQLARVVDQIDDYQYAAERATGVSGSVGGHVRHCLDHVAALVDGVAAARVNYDLRRRGTAVERHRSAALARIGELSENLAGISRRELDRGVELVTGFDAGGVPVITSSSMSRELAFVVSHTIHHFAIIALLLRELGFEVPSRFGYAPSTPSEATAA